MPKMVCGPKKKPKKSRNVPKKCRNVPKKHAQLKNDAFRKAEARNVPSSSRNTRRGILGVC